MKSLSIFQRFFLTFLILFVSFSPFFLVLGMNLKVFGEVEKLLRFIQ